MKEDFSVYFSDSAEGWGFNIITCGYSHIQAGNEYPSKGHPPSHQFTWEKGRSLEGFYLVYIPAGSGKFETNTKLYEINPGDTMLIYDKDWHRYQPNPTTGWEEYWIGFDSKHLRNHVVPDLFPNKESHLKQIGYHEDILIVFNHLLKLASNRSEFANKILFGYLLQLLAYFSNQQKNKIHTNRTEYVIEKSVHTIRQNISYHIDFKELTQLFNISYSQFRKIFKKETGLSPQQYLINERIECAKRLLVNTELTLKEIAEKSGFNSIHYFSRIFKQKTGQSPSTKRHSIF